MVAAGQHDRLAGASKHRAAHEHVHHAGAGVAIERPQALSLREGEPQSRHFQKLRAHAESKRFDVHDVTFRLGSQTVTRSSLRPLSAQVLPREKPCAGAHGRAPGGHADVPLENKLSQD